MNLFCIIRCRGFTLSDAFCSQQFSPPNSMLYFAVVYCYYIFTTPTASLKFDKCCHRRAVSSIVMYSGGILKRHSERVTSSTERLRWDPLVIFSLLSESTEVVERPYTMTRNLQFQDGLTKHYRLILELFCGLHLSIAIRLAIVPPLLFSSSLY